MPRENIVKNIYDENETARHLFTIVGCFSVCLLAVIILTYIRIRIKGVSQEYVSMQSAHFTIYSNQLVNAISATVDLYCSFTLN